LLTLDRCQIREAASRNNADRDSTLKDLNKRLTETNVELENVASFVRRGDDIFINAGAQVVATRSDCSQNKTCGIVVHGEGTEVTLRQSVCRRNAEVSGIYLNEGVVAKIIGGACDSNGWSGVWAKRAGIRIDGLSAVSNRSYGIGIEANSNADILNCRCISNTLDGIEFIDGSSGSIRNCSSQKNERYGVFLSKSGDVADTGNNFDFNTKGPSLRQ
jgi:hypothetical protein